ncbi:helix-turn-helix domain-containing protein [Salinisphaera orenii]|uniref:helix-turn-helix domain-containing protein n=1 Tax=Salinisphaera orenii TaxID=856731 RepID=UPI000DBE23B0
MPTNHLLTPAEAARYLRVSGRTLIRWRNQRAGPAFTHVGQKVVYQEKDLQLWLDAQRVEPVRGAQA